MLMADGFHFATCEWSWAITYVIDWHTPILKCDGCSRREGMKKLMPANFLLTAYHGLVSGTPLKS